MLSLQCWPGEEKYYEDVCDEQKGNCCAKQCIPGTMPDNPATDWVMPWPEDKRVECLLLDGSACPALAIKVCALCVKALS